MLRRSGLALTMLALAVIVAPQAWADVIPSRRTAKSADADRVTERLEGSGMAPAAARAEAAALTTDEAAYFAAAPGRVQVVAGLYFEEIMGALGLFGVLLLLYWIVQRDINNSG